MNQSWVPASAASLATGAIALLLGMVLLPSGGDTAGSTLLVVQEADGRWFAAAVLMFLAGVTILLGLPSLMALFGHRRGRRPGLVAIAVMAIACAGTAGFGMLLVFFRALALAEAIKVGSFDTVVEDAGLNVFLYAWIASFYIGELLIAIAVLRAGTAPTWIPTLLILHVVTLPLGEVLPDEFGTWSVLLISIGLAGLAITANNRALIDLGRRPAR